MEKEIYAASNFHCVFRTEKEQLTATAGYIYGGIEEDELIFLLGHLTLTSVSLLNLAEGVCYTDLDCQTWKKPGGLPSDKGSLSLLNTIIPCLSPCMRNS